MNIYNNKNMENIEEVFNKPEIHTVWDELKTMRDALSGRPLEQMKQFINENMADDVKDLKKMFKKDFETLPKDDPLRLEVLQTLGELGIIIHH
jgi:hypothetical protein